MKNYLIFSLVFTIFITNAFAQIQSKVAFGINSFNLSSESSGRVFNQESSTGYQAGLSVAIGNKLYFEPGIFYYFLNSDMTITNKNDSESIRTSVDIQLLRLPIYLGYSIISNQKYPANFRVFAGPSLSVFTFLNTSNTIADLGKDDLESVQWGLNGGIGINLGIFYFDAIYEQGLSDFFKDDPNSTKSQVFSLVTGIRF